MDDYVEMWREMRKEKQERRARNLLNNRDHLTVENGWVKHTEHHYTRVLSDYILQYWPSANKWQWRGKIHVGDFTSLSNFIRNREK